MENNKKTYTYISHGKEEKVYCTYKEYLYLKLNYDDNGVTEEEYNLLKTL